MTEHLPELIGGLSLADRYRLLEPLGSGGMADVWLAHDEREQREVALKFLKPELATQPGFIELFKDEAERCRRLSHPAIVRIYGFHADQQHSFIAMEYLPGGSLLKSETRHWRAVLQLLLPVVDALEYAHNARFIHRDLRAANVLLDKAGRPRITDFGIGVSLQDKQQTLSGGSLPSMSPQQIDGESPQVSDDVYGFGALLYEILSGEPLFHPDVTPERVRNAEPPRLSTLVTEIPPELDRLVASLLDKQIFRRPPGMAAVRASMESILAEQSTQAAAAGEEDNAIRPVARKSANRKGPEAGFKPRRLQNKDTTGSSAWRLYALLGSLAVIALGVIFLLPAAVKNNREIVETAPKPLAAEPEAPAVSPAENQVSRELADTALAELLRLSDQLKGRAVELWGGSDWFTAVNKMVVGDEAYKKRDFAAAMEAYREALSLLEPLPDKVADVLQTALADGEQAILDGNQRLAVERYDLALAIEPGNLTATKGKERALQLDRVIKLVNEASAFEVAEAWEDSLNKYEEALAVDPEWEPALNGRDRVSGVIANNAYQSAMSSGYTALVEQRYDTARTFFNAALKARPGDADARQALEQIENDQRLARVSSLNRQAQQKAAAEDWQGAVSLYQAVLAVDTSVTAARNGLAESQRRLELDQRMRDSIASPDRLSDMPVLEATRQLLDYARSVAEPGPVLLAQLTELDSLVRRAVVPVSVLFESDGLTEVVIYKVGRFAPFTAQNIELRPGVYTAVGVRSGYRDVRLSFRVQPESAMQPITIRCEDPI